MTEGSRVFVAGTGMTSFGSGRELRAMSEAAAREALSDAGLGAGEVQRVYFGNGTAGVVLGQEMVRGQVALRDTDIHAQVINVENACASGSSALMLATEAVAAGRCDVAMALGAEQLSHDDRRRAFTALRGATDVLDEGRGPDGADTKSVFMDVYAEEARRYIAEFDATVEDLALIAVKNRRHASANPKAHFRTPQTVDEVLAGRMIADPLTLPMCSPTTDGAAAIVVCSEAVARRLGRTAVEVRAAAMAPGRGAGSHPVQDAARAAYEAASLGPEDLDLVELHDAAAPAELVQYAEVGLCDAGEGHLLLRKHATEVGGATPVNASGGLLSRGHPLGATGCAQVVEIADQLRGRATGRQVEGARVGLAVNGGGWLDGSYALAVATVLVGERA